MLHPQHIALLEKLKEAISEGMLTPVDTVGPGTFLCITQSMPMGMAYHQVPYDSAPPELAALFKDRKKGEKIGDMKIVAIYDIWPDMPGTKQAPPYTNI